MIESFIHKGLKELFQSGKSAKVPANLRARCARRLDALDSAAKLENLNLPGFDFHPLRAKPVRYSIHVNRLWCLTFEWNDGIAKRVDLSNTTEVSSCAKNF